ncbi:MAG: deoxyribose-phosphate aldolase [Bacteroidaceae bacterium]|nr:deoxyribose-phosphate aldolase [Bacteroidaceae bacterium]
MEMIDEMGELDAKLAAQPRVSRSSEAFAKYNMSVDEKQVESILEKAAKDSISAMNPETLTKLFSVIDLTRLKPGDSEDDILKLVEKVNAFDNNYPDMPSVASVCTYPCYAKLVHDSLEVEKVRTCCVAGGFPNAQTFIEVKVAETGLALHDGADEIDVVMNPGFILNGNYEDASMEIDEIKSVCGEKTLKVILETAALSTLENVKKAAIIAMYSGADFIKTSTGKEVPGADPKSFCVMCQAAKEYYAETGRKVGVKVAGGIRQTSQVLLYWTIVKNVLGDGWLSPEYFRIGASRLANELLSDITGSEASAF